MQKPHALKGEVKAVFQFQFTGKKIKTLYIGDESPLPYPVEHLQPIGNNLFILKTEDCNNRNQSEELTGKKIYVAEADFAQCFEADDASWLIGWRAVADGKMLGMIDDVFALPQQYLAQVMVDGKEVLIPLNDKTMVKTDKAKKTLFLKLPDGLLDI